MCDTTLCSAVIPPVPQIVNASSTPPTTTPVFLRIHDLKFHLVWSLAVSQAEVGGKVACEHILLLDGGKDWLVNGFLVGCTGGSWLLCL